MARERVAIHFPASRGAGGGGRGVSAATHNATRYQKRRARRRRVVPGYPVPAPLPFDKARAYMALPMPVCLLCGRELRALGVHLRTIHGMTSTEYRETYALPYRTGLISAELKAVKSAAGRRPEHLAHLDRIRRQSDAAAAQHERGRRHSYHDSIARENLPPAKVRA